MTKFEIPSLPTDEELSVMAVCLIHEGADPAVETILMNGKKEMRDQLAPHQLAAERMFEALSEMTWFELDEDIAKLAYEALADVQKIYEGKK